MRTASIFSRAVLLGTACLALVIANGCRGCAACDTDGVVVYTSVDQVFSEPIFRHCEQVTGLQVRAVFDTEETKSTGVLNRLIAEAKQPQADVFWSGDPVRPFVLIQRGLVQPHVSAVAQGLPAAFRA
jgi:iron(III) transport system substrate-binding protein